MRALSIQKSYGFHFKKKHNWLPVLFFKNQKSKVDWNRTKATRMSTNARNRYKCYQTSIIILYLNVVQILFVTRNVVILWLFDAPHESASILAASAGYSSTKVVPLAFLLTRQHHAISRIFLNSSRNSPREIPKYVLTSVISVNSKWLWKNSCKDRCCKFSIYFLRWIYLKRTAAIYFH